MSVLAPVLAPGATIGILGGGQLGRMLALAAARIGFKCHVFAPTPDSPAFDVVHRVTHADYADTQALDRFAADVDVVTYEFENVPAETATFLAARVPVLPDPKVLATTQDRLAEKNFVAGLGIRTAPYAAAGAPSELAAALDRIGRPAVLKTRRFGYDGKGQATINNGTDLAAAWSEVGGQPCIVEAFVPFAREVSVVAERGRDGAVECFDVSENEHRAHILKISRVPADLPETTAHAAQRIAEAIADSFAYVGVLAVEMFVVGGELLVNELAPRPHNSGHWTLDASATSQFEQQIRAVCGVGLGRTTMTEPSIAMVNLLGDLWANGTPDWSVVLDEPRAKLHLYGKSPARRGRKMGHLTVTSQVATEAVERALELRRRCAR